jgi:exopolyphosphatase/guanosine-5'-triphosphate,3'-diphosphate pyrophosphatase
MGKNSVVAVIDIGSTAIRLIIAEISPDGEWKMLDRASRPVNLGKDVFLTGNIGNATMSQSLQILSGFAEVLNGWQISRENVKVVGTSALREARNRDTFTDRVELQTGFFVNAIEGIEENRLTYVAVRYALKDARLRFNQLHSLIIEVGGGSTEIMLLERGKIVAAHSMNIGTVRLEQQIRSIFGSTDYLNQFLTENISAAGDIIDTEFKMKRIRNFIAVGGDVRLAARFVGREGGAHFRTIERKGFDVFVDEVKGLSVDESAGKFQISYNEAEWLTAALLIYQSFLHKTSAASLVVPDVSIREGLLLSLAVEPDPEIQEEFNSQVIASAASLGRKYYFDEAHARHVTNLALSLFDQLQDSHGLDGFSRLLLEVAGLLHDVGTYVRSSGHHKHGQYIILNSDIFGLHRDEIDIVSNVVRYHRKVLPATSHISYISLPRERRIVVSKLAAILRVADALDKGHKQRIEKVNVEIRGDELLIRNSHSGDISIERYGLARKVDMMEEVFGLKVVLL